MNPVRLAEAIRRFGPIFAQYYGQSEAPMVITYLAKGDHDEKRLTSCGRPTLFARTALLGEDGKPVPPGDGKPVPPGEVGEICVSGALLAGGYWNLPEATAETFRDGCLHAGDMAREDEDGFWFIVDRTKDMIVTGGFNVFPREVEDVVAEHWAIAQVCVIGTPDEKWGEAVTAVVVLRPDAPNDDTAIATMTSGGVRPHSINSSITSRAICHFGRWCSLSGIAHRLRPAAAAPAGSPAHRWSQRSGTYSRQSSGAEAASQAACTLTAT
jgi:fatty-acyl-CoA synthase